MQFTEFSQAEHKSNKVFPHALQSRPNWTSNGTSDAERPSRHFI